MKRLCDGSDLNWLIKMNYMKPHKYIWVLAIIILGLLEALSLKCFMKGCYTKPQTLYLRVHALIIRGLPEGSDSKAFINRFYTKPQTYLCWFM
jgi:hypothetical protein